jgi:hypothetical protein
MSAQLVAQRWPLPVARGGTDSSNDGTVREAIWRRFPGEEWAAYDALPVGVRRRIQENAYDPWSVNALILWRAFRRETGSSARAERRLLRYLDECEALERTAFADAFVRAYGTRLPHNAAQVGVLRRALLCAASECTPPFEGDRRQDKRAGASSAERS